MITPRWRKILSDLWGNKARTLLVALSIAVGVFAVGLVGSSYFLISHDIQADFLKANPHDGMIYSDLFDDDLLGALGNTEGVGQVEGRTSVYGQVKISTGEKVGIMLNGVNALEKVKIDKIFLLSGKPTLRSREVYIDRGSFAALGVKEGDTISVELFGGKMRDLRVVGVVHDAYADGFSGARRVTGYINLDTIEWMGGSRQYSTVVYKTTGAPPSEAYSRAVADQISDKLKKGGRNIYYTLIFPPGRHPGQQTVDSVLALLGGMGVLAVFLSTFLVINTISALLNQQIRQIGVMKAIGATFGQVVGMYLVLILLFGIVALLIAVPLSALGAYALAMAVVNLLNSSLQGLRVPTESLLMMIAVGLGVPLFAGFMPVINGARLTVREAMSNYGISNNSKRGLFDMILETVRGLPRPLLISLRNTFRRKARLVLTLFTLMLGGAIFMSVFNVRDALMVSIEQTFGYLLSDVNVSFDRFYRMDRIRNLTQNVEGITTMEGWGEGTAQILRGDGKTMDEVDVMAPPAGSQMIKPVMTEGRWLTAADDNGIVVGNHFTKLRPEVKVGDEIKVRVNKKDYAFRVVGFYQIAGTFLRPVVYMNAESYSRIRNEAGLVYSIRVSTELKDPASQQKVAKDLQATFTREGITVGQVITGNELIAQSKVTIDILVYLLLAMAMLIALVGGLGLMGTMSMNVMERTREIGVMRSIGAVDWAIMQLVLVEGMIIGVISWVLGALLSVPITNILDEMLGVSLINVPLPFTFSMQGMIVWVIVVIVLSFTACILPARNAVRLTVRDVLAYE